MDLDVECPVLMRAQTNWWSCSSKVQVLLLVSLQTLLCWGKVDARVFARTKISACGIVPLTGVKDASHRGPHQMPRTEGG